MTNKQSSAESSGSADTTDDVQQSTNNSSSSASGYKKEVGFGDDGEEEDGDFTDEFQENDNSEHDGDTDNTDEESNEELSLRERVMDVLEETLEDEDALDRRGAQFEVAHKLMMDSDDEELSEMIDEVSVTNENGDITDVSNAAFMSPDDEALSWENIRRTYNAEYGKAEVYRDKTEKKKAARLQAVERLMEDYNWMYYCPEETGEEDLYYYNEDLGKYERDSTLELEGILEEKLGVHHESAEVSEIERKIEARTASTYDGVNARHMDGTWLNCANCVIRIDEDSGDGPWDWETREHSPEFKFTSQSADNAVWPFHNDEHELNTEDLRWTIEWMQSLFDDDHSWKVLAEIFGGVLRPDQKFKFFGLLVGPTNAGKSKVMTALRGMLGRDNTTGVEFQKLAEGDFDSAEMFRAGGRMLNSGNDIQKKKLKTTSVLKTLTTNDYESHDVKHDWAFEKVSPTTQVHIANREFVMDSDEGAIPGRMKYLRLPFRFEPEYRDVYDEDADYIKKADPDLVEKLKRSGVRSALLILALEGLHRLYENDGTFSFKKGEGERWDDYLARADTVGGEFAGSCLQNTSEMKDGVECYLTLDEAYNVYKGWAQKNDRTVKRKDQFSKLLNQVPNLRFSAQRSSRVSEGPDKEQVRWGLALKGEGFDHCQDGDVIERMDQYGIDGPNSNDEDAADKRARWESTVKSIIGRVDEQNASGATYRAIVSHCRENRSEVDEILDTFADLEERGEIVEDDDGVFRVVEEADEDNTTDDDDGNDDTDDEGARKHVARTMWDMADGAMTGVSRAALTGELHPMDADKANDIIDELCEDSILAEADEDNMVIALIATKEFVNGDA